MQSGRGALSSWLLEYEAGTTRNPENLMGWSSASNTLGQVKLKFPSLEDAKAYAEREGLEYNVLTRSNRKIKPRNYGDAFKDAWRTQ